jgi:hypothetical protein
MEHIAVSAVNHSTKYTIWHDVGNIHIVNTKYSSASDCRQLHKIFRWGNNIKMDPSEMLWKDVDWINLPEDKN